MDQHDTPSRAARKQAADETHTSQCTPSRPLMDRLKDLDQTWSSQKVPGTAAAATYLKPEQPNQHRPQNKNDEDTSTVASAETSIQNQSSSFSLGLGTGTPGKPLHDKLHSLEQQWSAQKSVRSGRSSSRTDTDGDDLSLLLLRLHGDMDQAASSTSSSVEQTEHAEQAIAGLPLHMQFGMGDTEGHSLQPHPKTQQTLYSAKINGNENASMDKSTGSFPRRRALFTNSSPGHDLSIGESTISTQPSNGDGGSKEGKQQSVFERLYSKRKLSPRELALSTTPRNDQLHDTISVSSADKIPYKSYTPKMGTALQRRSRDRIGFFQSSTSSTASLPSDRLRLKMQQQPRQSKNRSNSKNIKFPNEASSVGSALSEDDEASLGVFLRLHKNQKRQQRLWQAPEAMVPKLPSNGNSKWHSRTNETSYTGPKEVSAQDIRSPPLPDTQNNRARSPTIDDELAEIERVGKDIKALQNAHRNTDTSKQPNETSFVSTSAAEALTLLTSFALDDESDEDDSMDGLVSPMQLPQRAAIDDANMAQVEVNGGPPSNDVHCNPRHTDGETSKKGHLMPGPSHESLDSGSNSQFETSHQSGFLSLDQPSGGLVLEYHDPAAFRSDGWISLQSLWRYHRAQLDFAKFCLDDWTVDVFLRSSGLIGRLSFLQQFTKVLVVKTSIARIDCAWLLDGLYRAQDKIIMSWEKDIALQIQSGCDQINMNESAIVRVWCEAPQYRILKKWSDRKIATKFIQASLELLLQTELPVLAECAVLRIQSLFRGYLCRKRNATMSTTLPISEKGSTDQAVLKLQRWTRLNLLRRALEADERHCLELRKAIPSPKSFDPSNVALAFSDASTILKASYEDFGGSISDDASFLTKSSQDELSNFQRMGVESSWDLRISALAIHQIVGVYLTSLRSYRRNKKASRIQAQFRAYRAAHAFALKRKAVRVLQSAIRKSQGRNEQKAAINTIQRSWRRSLTRRHLQLRRNATILVQRCWRMYQASLGWKKCKTAIILVQSAFRCYQHRKRFDTLVKGITTLQTAFLERRRKCTRASAVLVQAYWRRYSAMNRFGIVRFAATTVQSIVRRHAAETNFNTVRSSSIKIQSFWSIVLVKRQIMLRLSALIRLQTVWRMARARSHFRRFVLSSIEVQRVFRGYNTKRLLCVRSEASTRLQRSWRSFREYQVYRCKQQACVVIQRTFRRAYERRLLRQNTAAQTCQSVVRMLLVRRKFVRCQAAVAILQTTWRAMRLKALARTATKIQKKWRRIVKQRLECQKLAATKCQSIIRMAPTRATYLRIRAAAITIQVARRNFTLMRRINSTIKIQRMWRCIVEGRLRRRETAAIQCQSMARMMLIRNELWRCQTSAKHIQVVWRSFIFKQHRAAATKIQAALRMLHHKQRYQSSRTRLVLMQIVWRRVLAKTMFQNNKAASVRVQKWWRWRKLLRILQARHFERRLQASHIIKSCWQKYAAKRTLNAMRIQAAMRGVYMRKMYYSQRCSAVKVQSWVRTSSASGKYRTAKHAVLTIQTIYRYITAVKRKARTKHAAATIQLFWLVRRQRKLRLASIIAIQKYWRRFHAQVKWQNTVRSCCKIQTIFRGHCIRTEMQRLMQPDPFQRVRRVWLHRSILANGEELERRRSAAQIIQSAWRGISGRKKCAKARVATTKIQATIRGVLATRHYTKIVTAHHQRQGSAISIQSVWRRATQQESYARSRISVVCIQALCRGAATRRVYAVLAAERHAQIESAVHIQAIWRGVLSLDAYTRQRVAVLMIQSIARALVAKKLFQARLVDMREQIRLATRVQAFWRGRAQWKTYRLQSNASVKIESMVRTVQHVKRYRIYRSGAIAAVTTLQHVFRRLQAMHAYAIVRLLVLKLQAIARCIVAKKQFSKARKNIVLLQGSVRRYVARKRLLVLQQAYNELLSLKATSVQKFWRLCSASRQFRKTKNASILVQSYVRRLIVIKHYGQFVASSIRLQTWMRTCAEKAKFKKTLAEHKRQVTEKNAAMIQAAWRGFAYRNLCLQALNEVENICAIKIQTNFRAAQVRTVIILWHGSAMLIQSSWRGFVVYSFHQRQACAAIVLQRVFREYCVRKATAKLRQKVYYQQSLVVKYVTTILHCNMILTSYNIWKIRWDRRKHAARSIQRVWLARARQKFLEEQASKLIQKHWRSATARSNYTMFRVSAVFIQSNFRGYSQRRVFVRALESCVRIQTNCRMFAMATCYKNTKLAASVVQNWWVTHLRQSHSRRVPLQERSCILLQKNYWRGIVARKHALEACVSAIAIQSNYRQYIHRRRYIHTKDSCLTIQSHFRMWTKAMHHKKLKSASATLKLWWSRHTRKAHLKKTAMETSACVLIQKYWRGAVARELYSLARISAILIQANLRRQYRRHIFVQTVDSCIKIQAHFRRWAKVNQYNKLKSAVKVLQSWRLARTQRTKSVLYRVNQSQRTFAATLIKRSWMTYQTNHLQAEMEAAVAIQKIMRRSILRNRFARMQRAAIVVQSGIRCHAKRLEYSRMRHACTIIQSVFRYHKARDHFHSLVSSVVVVQRNVRKFSMNQNYLRKKRGAILIQSCIRAHNACRSIKMLAAEHLRCVNMNRSAKRVIRAACFRWMLRRRQQRKSASSTMQSVWRRAIEERRYASFRDMACRLQAAARRRICVVHYKRLKAAILTLQMYVRRWNRRLSCKRQMAASGIIQKHWRASIARNALLLARASATLIQCLFRGVACRSKLRYCPPQQHMRYVFEEAARKIQVAFFMWKMQLALWEVRSSIVLIRRSQRGQLSRNASKFALSHMNLSLRSSVYSSFARIVAESNPEVVSATVSWNRAIIHAREYAAVVLQSFGRRVIVERRIMTSFGLSFSTNEKLAIQRRRLFAAQVIQRAVRMWLERMATFITMVVKVQSVYREKRESRKYLRLRMGKLEKEKMGWAATVIQSKIRGEFQRQAFLSTISSVITLQSHARHWLAKSEHSRLKRATILAQKNVRCWLNNTKYKCVVSSVILVQRSIRRMQQQSRFRLIRKAVIILQSRMRCLRKRRQFTLLRSSASIIQRQLQVRFARNVLKQRTEALRVIQSFIIMVFINRRASRPKVVASGPLVKQAEAVLLRTHEDTVSSIFSGLFGEEFGSDCGPCLNRLVRRAQVATIESKLLQVETLRSVWNDGHGNFHFPAAMPSPHASIPPPMDCPAASLQSNKGSSLIATSIDVPSSSRLGNEANQRVITPRTSNASIGIKKEMTRTTDAEERLQIPEMTTVRVSYKPKASDKSQGRRLLIPKREMPDYDPPKASKAALSPSRMNQLDTPPVKTGEHVSHELAKQAEALLREARKQRQTQVKRLVENSNVQQNPNSFLAPLATNAKVGGSLPVLMATPTLTSKKEKPIEDIDNAMGIAGTMPSPIKPTSDEWGWDW